MLWIGLVFFGLCDYEILVVGCWFSNRWTVDQCSMSINQWLMQLFMSCAWFRRAREEKKRARREAIWGWSAPGGTARRSHASAMRHALVSPRCPASIAPKNGWPSLVTRARDLWANARTWRWFLVARLRGPLGLNASRVHCEWTRQGWHGWRQWSRDIVTRSEKTAIRTVTRSRDVWRCAAAVEQGTKLRFFFSQYIQTLSLLGLLCQYVIGGLWA